MVHRMRFLSKFVVANERGGAVEADGKPARAKLKENRSREARKRRMERETICGKPEKEFLDAGGLREGREEDSQRMTLAGSPKKKNLAREACGKAARKIRKE